MKKVEYAIGNFDEVFWTIVRIKGKKVSTMGLFSTPEYAENFIVRFCQTPRKEKKMRFEIEVLNTKGEICDTISILAASLEEAKYFVRLELNENQFVI